MLTVITNDHGRPGGHRWHSSGQYARTPDCDECRSIAEFEANPPRRGPEPHVYTDADLRDGADALLGALRREFRAYFSDPRLAYSDGFLDDTVLAVITRDVTHSRKGFDYALRGDAVLLKTAPEPPADGDEIYTADPRLAATFPVGTVSVWCPRTRGMVLMRPEWLRVV